jgi:hypothetical protein
VKALSVRQPWANLIAQGRKTVETRTWPTAYRGDLVICSSKKPLIYRAGVALCVVELYAVVPMGREHEAEACCELYPGAWAWKLRNLRPLKPFPVRGQLRIFDLTVPRGEEG